jgi:hypothetical protein
MAFDLPIHSFVFGFLVVAVYALPVIVIVWVIQALRQARRPDPRAVLAHRLSRGEITPQEFDTAMRALGLADPRR